MFPGAPMQPKNEDIYVTEGYIGNKSINMPRFLKNEGRLRTEILYMPQGAKDNMVKTKKRGAGEQKFCICPREHEEKEK